MKPKRQFALFGVLAIALWSCGTSKETPPTEPGASTPSVAITPHAMTVTASATFSFSIAVTPAANRSRLQCRVEPSSVGTVSLTTDGCRLVTGAPAVPGRLIASVDALSDTATLVVFASASR